MSIWSHLFDNQFSNNEAFLAASLFMDAGKTLPQYCFDFSKKLFAKALGNTSESLTFLARIQKIIP